MTDNIFNDEKKTELKMQAWREYKNIVEPAWIKYNALIESERARYDERCKKIMVLDFERPECSACNHSPICKFREHGETSEQLKQDCPFHEPLRETEVKK